MEHRARSKLNTQIYDEACEWFVNSRAEALDDATRREFDRWLRKSPEHLSAYLEIAAIWSEGATLDPKNEWDADTLIAQAAQDRDNIIPLSGVSHSEIAPDAAHAPSAAAIAISTTTTATTPQKKRPGRLIAVAASILVLVVGTSFLVQSARSPTYTTAVGEQRSLVLADGSTVELNSRSRVRVHFSKYQRDVELLEGQALFHVAKDPARPFVVASGATRVRAVGTQFDVYKKHDDTVVTVVEGRVAVLKGTSREITAVPSLTAATERGGEPPILLDAGEQLTVTPKTAQRAVHPNIAGATAWKQRQLVFESASLFEVAEEFNRYNERQLVIDDGARYDFHISGVFSSTDPSALIRFLRERPGLRVIEGSSEIRVTKK